MQANEVEPLDFALWADRIGQVSRWPLEETMVLERALRHTFHLVQLAPHELRAAIACGISEAEFEALLDNRAYLKAAEALQSDTSPVSLVQTASLGARTTRTGATISFLPLGESAAAAGLLREWIKNLADGSATETGNGAEQGAGGPLNPSMPVEQIACRYSAPLDQGFRPDLT